MSVFKTSICLFVFRLLFFPMISPWYVPLSSQPRPYHKSNTGKHGGKKLACEKCIFMNYWPRDFTCVVLAFVVHSPRCLQASKRGACTMENKVLQRSGSMLARQNIQWLPPQHKKWAHLFCWIFCAMNSFFVSGQDLGKTRRRDESKNTLYFRSIPDSNTGGCEVRSAWRARS